jgi:2-iminobutanoate/2-iminopropanoate deaminase
LKTVPPGQPPEAPPAGERKAGVLAALVASLSGEGDASKGRDAGVKMVARAGTIAPAGSASLASRAGDFLFVAGMGGNDPKTGAAVENEAARIRQAFLNLKMVAEFEGSRLADCVRLVVYLTDMARLRPLVDAVQAQLWAGSGYPPRTMVEVARLGDGEGIEIEATFYLPQAR